MRQVVVFIILLFVGMVVRGCTAFVESFNAKERGARQAHAARISQSETDLHRRQSEALDDFIKKLGGRVEFHRTNPDTDISAFLHDVAKEVYPEANRIEVSVENFTDFCIRVIVSREDKEEDKEKWKNWFLAGLGNVVSVCTNYLSAVELVMPAYNRRYNETEWEEFLLALDKEGIDSISNWRTASTSDISRVLYKP